MSESGKLVEATYTGVMLNDLTSMSAIIVQVPYGEQYLNIPIMIPDSLGRYILQYTDADLSRPEMVDTWIASMDAFNIVLGDTSIVISKLEDDIYYSEIHMVQEVHGYRTEVVIDCKTSVAIVLLLALQKKDRPCKIFIDQAIVDKTAETAMDLDQRLQGLDNASDPQLIMNRALDILTGTDTDEDDRDDPEEEEPA